MFAAVTRCSTSPCTKHRHAAPESHEYVSEVARVVKPRRSVRVRFQRRRQSVWRGLGGESLGLATLPVTCGLLLLHHVKRVVL
ncbi:hypothetical protein O3P69_012465 [Scylla paramamosain]|uniref:Uncharacterized protein n=1 Tax=Scylla paramamosain TaxID=85552 RepID=A0AAW0SD22_SCYPA